VQRGEVVKELRRAALALRYACWPHTNASAAAAAAAALAAAEKLHRTAAEAAEQKLRHYYCSRAAASPESLYALSIETLRSSIARRQLSRAAIDINSGEFSHRVHRE
jgi:hypothetical protein